MAGRPYILWTLTAPAPDGASDGRAAFLHVPFVQIELLSNALDLKRLQACRSGIVTSQWALKAVEFMLEGMQSLFFYAIGDATRRALYQAGIGKVIVPERFTGTALIQLLRQQPPAAPVFFPRGRWGGKQVLAHLNASQLASYSPIVYRTLQRPAEELLRSIPEGARPAAVALGSPSAVGVWQRVRRQLGDGIPVATVGPTTAAACRRAGLSVWLEADSGSSRNLADLLARRLIRG